MLSAQDATKWQGKSHGGSFWGELVSRRDEAVCLNSFETVFFCEFLCKNGLSCVFPPDLYSSLQIKCSLLLFFGYIIYSFARIFHVIGISNFNFQFKIVIFVAIIMVQFEKNCGIHCPIWRKFLFLILSKMVIWVYGFFFFFSV